MEGYIMPETKRVEKHPFIKYSIYSHTCVIVDKIAISTAKHQLGFVQFFTFIHRTNYEFVSSNPLPRRLY